MSMGTEVQHDEPAAGEGHNSGAIARDRLRAFIERVERLDEEKATLAADIREVYAEAKGSGFDPKIMRQVVKLRRMDPEQRKEQDLVLDTYLSALGMLVFGDD